MAFNNTSSELAGKYGFDCVSISWRFEMCVSTSNMACVRSPRQRHYRKYHKNVHHTMFDSLLCKKIVSSTNSYSISSVEYKFIGCEPKEGGNNEKI